MENATGEGKEVEHPVSLWERIRLWSVWICKVYLVLSAIFAVIASGVFVWVQIHI